MKLPFELESGEEVLLFERRHWMAIVPKSVAKALLFVVPLALVIGGVSATVGLGGTAGKIVTILAVAWAVVLLVRAYFDWYRYLNDVWVVTNQRVIDSVKPSWFKHEMASADLVDIQDISIERNGFVPTVFRFGDVRCQTAGEQPHFIFAGIPNPGRTLELVDRARDAARREILRMRGKP